ncbi:hypothetical protein HDU98_011314 [Podochytrium sp. JEL0797]|nr:hypothetical protein HDU98_011314 [Podochytrium sp. JEL0797]
MSCFTCCGLLGRRPDVAIPSFDYDYASDDDEASSDDGPDVPLAAPHSDASSLRWWQHLFRGPAHLANARYAPLPPSAEDDDDDVDDDIDHLAQDSAHPPLLVFPDTEVPVDNTDALDNSPNDEMPLHHATPTATKNIFKQPAPVRAMPQLNTTTSVETIPNKEVPSIHQQQQLLQQDPLDLEDDAFG